ncbi:MAG: DNA polymerase III subunit beta, partial [Muribaculaceae bacterium]|nr:DNA polymerase III subunit beta [Muribaculaceae bacterium]
MRFNVSSKMLYSHASAVSKVINSKNAMTILNNFLFVLKGNQLTITASDIENTLSATIEVNEAEGEGMFCVDARKIVELLKELPDQGIRFDVNNSNFTIEITYLNGRYNLIGYNGMEFPNEQDADPAILDFKCPAKQILSGIDNTLFAVGTDELWPQMMGILWDLSPESITFVSTDSRKLVKYQNTESAPGVEGSFILPVKPANILKNILSGADTEVKVAANAKSATFTSGAYTFNCRFIKGNFPDYNRVIPKN